MAKKAISAKAAIRKSNLNLADIVPITDVQSEFFESYDNGLSQVLKGSAGTGKTFISLFKAFDEILNSSTEYRSIAIVRSAVATRDIGHLPGTLDEKSAIYELPYVGVCNELFQRGDAYGILKDKGVIKFMLTSYVRGITLDKTIVIVDEHQNLTSHELDSIMTRLGKDSKILFCGDTAQTDFTKHGEKDHDLFFQVLKRMPTDFNFHHFGPEDIVRSGLVRRYIQAKEK